jgi:hypothetical protein
MRCSRLAIRALLEFGYATLQIIDFRESANGSGYETLVAAHSRALEGVSRDIADALRAMAP